MRNLEDFRHPERRENLIRSRAVTPEPPETVKRLNRLLDGGAVETAGLAQEIRSHHELESLVLRITKSLALWPPDSAERLEEAIVRLGSDRLRVLLYTWSLLAKKAAQGPPPGSSPNWSPEALYLASFLRYLGLDSPDAAILHSEMFYFALDPQRAEFAHLRDTLMQDFLALLPILDASVLRPPTKT